MVAASRGRFCGASGACANRLKVASLAPRPRPRHMCNALCLTASCRLIVGILSSIMASSPVDLSRLSVSERLALLEELWDSLASEGAAAPISPALAAELDRRLAEMERDPDAGSPWEDVRARIEQRRR